MYDAVLFGEVCFNSRTRKGCDFKTIDRNRIRKFQFTHPQGVRCKGYHATQAERVSIHAPARGAIFTAMATVASSWFQFTHPQGVRYSLANLVRQVEVSIHAPARGAITNAECTQDSSSFNSRTRKGCDIVRHDLGADLRFQFTHPQGVRFL